MRLFLAGVYVFVVIIAVVIVASRFDAKGMTTVAPIVMPIVFFGALFTAYKWFGGSEMGMSIEEMEAQGLVERFDYKAKHAFCVREDEDMESHYFVELADGILLYLNGQYLFDYEPIEEFDDPKNNQQRNFPNSDFSVYRHKADNYTVEIKTRGDVFIPELELVLPSFPAKAHRAGLRINDGDIIRDKAYDEIKIWCLNQVSTR